MEAILEKILVIKIGTSTLTETQTDGTEKLDKTSFQRIGQQLRELQKMGYHIVVVSSAAISAGMMLVGLHTRPSKTHAMPSLQRLASIGWRHVLNAWADALQGVHIGELLLTKQELDLPSERDEVLRVTKELLTQGDIAIVNENDAITHAEIAFGDNDTLAATFATKLKQSDLFGDTVKLVILSDIDGVYQDPANKNTLIRTIHDVSHFQHVADGSSSRSGTGGMATKFAAAKIAISHGVEVYIANGREDDVIKKTLSGKSGTHFTC